ncbi:MAG: FUSC family protein [Clostridia bacterium]|nr:FUSC family protein [Clostridia bacterium]
MDLHLHFHIGQRNIKTALAATLCALIYFLADRNPTFACIGAIFGMGSDMDNSRLNGGNRFFGTLFGGLLGMGLFRLYILFYPDGSKHFLLLLFLFIGVIILILISLQFRWPGAVQPGGVVLCILLFNTPVNTYISYSLARILDTGIGVIIAMLVNWLLPREKVVYFLEKLHFQQKNSMI